jgi:phosphoribosylamine--glycine ligase
VVIEEGLDGVECSVQVLCDGRRVVPLAAARDFKRAFDGDRGANTGGMGSTSPPVGIDEAVVGRVVDEAIEPTVAALRARGIEYRGVLYAGVMVTADGPVILEFNVRLGDPEAQVVLPRLADDPVELFLRAASGDLAGPPAFLSDAAVCVVAAAAGYPESPRLGDRIEGLGPDGQLAEEIEGVTVLHAGTTRDETGAFRVAGGRVLGIGALAPTLEGARALAYRAASGVSWPGMQVRRDIGAEPSEVLR